MTEKFFEERKDQSEVKARIVQKYFFAWAQVIRGAAKMADNKVAYIDLYAGPGRYKDGAASTPILILEKALEDPELSQMLVTLLNDKDEGTVSALQSEIDKIDGIERLKYKPSISCGEVDETYEKYFSDTNLIPSFSFIDPFGYKGLSSKMIKGVIKDFGCDCVFFFNYSRINAGVTNPVVRDHMDALFGKERVDSMHIALKDINDPDLRESLILENLASEIKSLGGHFVLPFTFKDKNGNRTKHKIVFVTKHFKGYEIMKDIMAKESSTHDQGVPSLSYSPADERMPLLFSLQRPFENLKEDLAEKYHGTKIAFTQLYQEHSVDTPYIKKNYKDALMELEDDGVVVGIPTNGKKRRKGSFADHLLVQFKEA